MIRYLLILTVAISVGCDRVGDIGPVEQGDRTLPSPNDSTEKKSETRHQNEGEDKDVASPDDVNKLIKSDKVSEDLTLEILRGTWMIETVEIQGNAMEPQPGMPESFQIEGDSFSGTVGKQPMEGFSEIKLVLNTSTTPASLDFVREKNGRGESLPGIVALEGETLKLAMPLVPAEMEPGEGLQRPASFDSKDGLFMVFTAKRLE